MALASENLKSCGVKIKTYVGGIPSLGSGVIYVTPNYCDYNYVLTAKHIFQEDSQTTYDASKIISIEVFYSDKLELKSLEYINKEAIKKKLIVFEQDFIIILVKKTNEIPFNQILVSDELENIDTDFFSWGIFSANKDEIHKFNFKRNDPERKRFELTSNVTESHLYGMSGAGLFITDKSILHGIVSKYPNDNFQNATIDCTIISFSEINKILESNGKIKLDTKYSRYKKEIKNKVVDIHQAYINNVCLDIEKARKRLEVDIMDDWYHDPLRYIDLLNQNYLFKQLEKYFGGGKYKATQAESFYVPKKKFTLRQALVSPFIDRVIYMATVGVLAEKLDDAIIPNVFSARYNKFSSNQLIINGVEQWKKMQYKLAECANLKNKNGDYKYGCVLEIDLLNFYDNINKNLLNEKIVRVCESVNEKNAAKLLSDILSKFSTKESGLPQNSDASSLLATFYLNQVDVFMQHLVPAYYRFMDDVRIFCKDKYEARKILQTFEYEIRRCHLSVNSQKTKILTLTNEKKDNIEVDEKNRNDYDEVFNLELNKIARLRKSANYAYKNQAFHLSIKLLSESLVDEDIHSSEDKNKNLNYALNTITILGSKEVNLFNQDGDFKSLMTLAIRKLKDRPWITTHICKVLSLFDSSIIKIDFFDALKEIIYKESFNTYSFQTYQIWLLLAKHKCKDSELQQYAIKQIEKNDETNRPVIAAMIVYLSSVDSNYRRVILRKFGEGFTHGYFQNRISLISLRAFHKSLVKKAFIEESISKAHEFTHRYKNKDLVFVSGFEEDENSENFIEQLYSI